MRFGVDAALLLPAALPPSPMFGLISRSGGKASEEGGKGRGRKNEVQRDNGDLLGRGGWGV